MLSAKSYVNMKRNQFMYGFLQHIYLYAVVVVLCLSLLLMMLTFTHTHTYSFCCYLRQGMFNENIEGTEHNFYATAGSLFKFYIYLFINSSNQLMISL